jgi:tetratricopeptide (TPR) repeat protein
MRNYISLIALFLSSIFYAHASATLTPEQQYDKASKLYKSGNYAEASLQYQNLVNDGKRSTALFFNLGNCYYKNGEYAKAILNYERAKKIAPADDDIEYNLKLANAKASDKIDPIPQLFYEKWWSVFITSFSPTEWSAMAIITLWLAAGFFIIYLFAQTVLKKKRTFYVSIITFCISISLFLIAKAANTLIYHYSYAIIMDNSAYAKSAPDEKGTNLFLLHTGTKVEVVEEQADWKKIKIANGNTGWMSSSSLENI